MTNGFLRVAAASPRVAVADVSANLEAVMSEIERLDGLGVDLAVFPEMCLTAYTCGDLFHSEALLEAAREALNVLEQRVPTLNIDVVVGLPMVRRGAVRNCAAFISSGQAVIVEKTYLPSYNEFYESRWFAPSDIDAPATVMSHGVRVGIEICEDLWAPIPPSCRLAMEGAEVIVNLSASDDVVGKHAYLQSLIRQQSGRCLCAYAYASSGWGESSTDLVFTPKDIIAECGSIVAENDRFDTSAVTSAVIADVDIAAIRRDRLHNTTFSQCSRREGVEPYDADCDGASWDYGYLPAYRRVNSLPFVPADNADNAARCDEILFIQQSGLSKRLEVINARTLTVGISGGLDSTLALLVAVEAFDRLNIPRSGIIGVTMPGFGTTGRTYRNALSLMEHLGVTIREIPISKAVKQHFADIGHDPEVTDVTYENSQARERTQILMDVANQTGGIVLGTGDLSELALGWATYNGDHMSMYGVNAGVPKTLVRHLVSRYAMRTTDKAVRDVLLDIVDTPISPELIPADSDGNIAQKTEDLVGPYELHDFFLYYTLRYGFGPRRIFMLARKAFGESYAPEVILRWLKVFVGRFFSQQFKRSCLPDGPKVGSVCLSPRGDWRMPSDASARVWKNEIAELEKNQI